MPRSASEVGIEVEGRTSGTTEVCRTVEIVPSRDLLESTAHVRQEERCYARDGR
jgi:hypothetical protein